MKKSLIIPIIAAVVFSAACGDESNPTIPEQDTRASVRFFNATTGMASGGFTTNGQFTTGSALGFGQSSPTCARVDAGATSFGFGAATSGATSLSGNELASLSNQPIAPGGNYTVVAVGPGTKPTLFVFQNNPSNSPGGTEAAVRFLNLAPGTDTIANTYVVYDGAIGAGTVVGINMAVGAPSSFQVVASGSRQYSVLKLPGHVTAVEGSAGVLSLSGGSVYTFAILPQLGAWRLLNIPRC
jgi:hypothetical protein